MTLAMPIGSVKLPTAIKSQPNGAVDPVLLSWIEEARKGSTDLRFKMADLSARSMRAWHAHLTAVYGLDIRTTGRYRDLPGQWNIFGGAQARYRPCSLAEYNAAASTNRKTWPMADYTASTGQPAPGRATCARLLGVTIPDSTYWIKPSNLAMAAVPGTSNHGFGCADDLAEYINGVLQTSIRPSTLQILYATGHMFGFVWSTTTETWHVDWANGDVLTAATIAYEGGSQTPPSDPVYDEDMPTLYRDHRYGNVFLVNGDVTTVGPELFDSLQARKVPLVVGVHDQSLISFMRKSMIKMGQLLPSGETGYDPFIAPPDLQGS